MRVPAAVTALLAAALLGAPARAGAPDLFLEAEVAPARVYVATQAVYRLRLYQGVDLGGLQIAEPFAPLADIRPLGGERVYEAVRAGRRYRVRERSYALFPFASGELKIAGAQAAGLAPGGRRPVRAEAPPETLTVLPLPPAVQLAADSLTVAESWTPAPGPTEVGRVLRRVVRIEAAGVDAAQLPEIPMDIPGVAVHPEPPQLENRFRGTVNTASRVQSFRLVPRRPGTVAVPELRLPWWNVRSGVPETALLPSRTLEVAGGPAPPSRGAAAGGAPPGLLPAALAAGLGLLAGGLAWRRRERWAAAWRLRLAVRAGDPRAVCHRLLAWVATVWPGEAPRTVDALAGRLSDPAARSGLRGLERAVYGPAPGEAGREGWGRAVRLVRRDVLEHRPARRKAGKKIPRRGGAVV